MAKSPINARLEKAIASHQAGNLAEAERLYDQVLALSRENPDALNLKGVIASTGGRYNDAVVLFDRAIAALPGFAEAHFNRGVALASLGRTDEAFQSYADAISISPNHVDARMNAALLLYTLGHKARAIDALRQLIVIAPHDRRGFYNLGMCLAKTIPGAATTERDAMVNEARLALARAIELYPHDAETHLAFADLHAAIGEYSSAAECLTSALALKPSAVKEVQAEILSNIGEYLRKGQQFAPAVESQRRALALKPDDKYIRFNLGAALADNQETSEARGIYEQLVRSDPDFVRPYVNLAGIYRDDDRPDEALALLDAALLLEPSRQALSTMAAIFTEMGWLVTAMLFHDKAVSMSGDDPQARFNRSVSLLMLGQLAEGWPGYDLRFLIPSEMVPGRPTPPAYWEGGELRDKTIFIWTEQGVGDEALHSIFIPEMIRRSRQCIIESSPRMVPVFARSFPEARVVPRVGLAEALAEAARADVQVAVGSLGRYLSPDVASIPKHTGYLSADREKTLLLRRRYEDIARGRRVVGLAWKSKRKVYGKSKSTTPSDLGPILKVPGVMFVNLQYGDCREEIAAAQAKFGVEIFQDECVDALEDMDGFFAQVAAMDLVISTSNSAAHVAGALNTPIWLLLPHGRGALWYWFLRREDSPWYPSMKIFRAIAAAADEPWETEPVGRAGDALARWVRST